MKRKHLLLLSLLLSQSTSVWGMMPDPVEELHHLTQKSLKKVSNHPNYKRNATNVILIGDTGRGKSALFHYLAEKNLNVDTFPNSTKLFVDVDPKDLLPESEGISHTTIAGTHFPSSWYDSNNNIVYWDCTGFRDPQGPVKDIINGFAIYQLFKSPSPTKVVLVASENDADARGTEFLGLLKRVVDVLPEAAQLNPPAPGFSIVITKQQYFDPPHLLKTLLSQLNSGQNQFQMGTVKDFLEVLSSQDRSVAFPIPTQAGIYPVAHRTSILNCIDATQPMVNPKVNLVVDDPAKLLVTQYAQKINNDITDLINTKGLQKSVGFCNAQIDNNVNDIRGLRSNLRNVETYLSGLKNGLLTLSTIPDDQFTNYLDALFAPNGINFFPTKKLRGMIETLSFLKSIESNIAYATKAWAHDFDTILTKMQQLTKDPEITVGQGLLTLKGCLIGTSDVVHALQNHPAIKNVNVFGLNTLFIDQNITRPGTCLNFVAPQWKVLGDKTINLSGFAGSPGANGVNSGDDGQPGGLGENGGSLLCQGAIFSGLNHLFININGGNGGNGGHGRSGYNGSNGCDGSLYRVTKTEHYSRSNSYNDSHWFTGSYIWTRAVTGTREYYEDRGTNGASGGNGGKGGNGGYGGLKGNIQAVGFLCSDLKGLTAQNGGSGSHGVAGSGGSGGQHGRHCEGIKLTSLRSSLTVDSSMYPLGYYNQGHRNRSMSNEVEKSIQYQSYRGSNSSGNSGNGLNSYGQQQPPAQAILNYNDILRLYRADYHQAMTAGVAKSFPNL